ncbi:hypothetical protein OXX80_005168 [Metschnikowia pulcherrima]
MLFLRALSRSQPQAAYFTKRCLVSTTPAPAHAPPHKPVARPNLYEVLGKEEVTLAEFKEHPAFNSWLKKAVHSLNFPEFTSVQQKTILPFLQEEGLVCRAKTGTGKTFSFVIPLMQHVMDIFETARTRRRNVSCLVIAPTRDLAQQIHADFRRLNMHSSHLRHKCDVRLWTGGLPTGKRPWGSDVPQIIVGTPGRILANLEDRRWAQHFNELEYRVYDEADRLLDQGFEDQLNAIDSKLKSLRRESFEPPLRTLLFSATTNDRVTRFAEKQMGPDFKYIDCVDSSEAESHAHIEQRLVKTAGVYESHVAAVTEIMNNIKNDNYKAIFFLPTVVGADFMHRLLSKMLPERFPYTWMLHGKMTQGARRYTTDQFKKTKRGVLICTDVAARGLDFKGVSDVLQIAPSQNIEDYIHKIGRTGRAGQPGRATIFLSEPELNFSKQLYTKKHIEFSSETEFELTDAGKALLQDKVNDEEVRDYVTSLMGFESSVADTYRLDKFQLVRSLILLYRGITNSDDSTTLHLSTRMFNNMALPGALVPDYIEVDNPNAIKRKGNARGSQRDSFNRSTRYGGNDRFSGNRSSERGGYSGNRGGNRDGGYRSRDSGYGGDRNGGYKSRDSGYGGNRDGGYGGYKGGRDGGREGGNRSYGGNRGQYSNDRNSSKGGSGKNYESRGENTRVRGLE